MSAPEPLALHRDDFGARFGMWLFLVTEMLLFGGLFIAYAYMRSRYPVDFHAAGATLDVRAGLLNTALLLTSSLFVALSVLRLQEGRPRASALWLGLTLLLGLGFLAIKSLEWSVKIHHGLYPDSPHLAALPLGQQIFFGLYYAMTGLHGLHVLAGLGLLGAILSRVLRGSVHAGHPTLLVNGSLYWHLVDVVWIFLLPLFYLAA